MILYITRVWLKRPHKFLKDNIIIKQKILFITFGCQKLCKKRYLKCT